MKKILLSMLIVLMSRGAIGYDYKVKKNDSLWKIAKREYGRGSWWPKIFRVNAHKLPRGPSRIRPGMILTIPSANLDSSDAPVGYYLWREQKTLVKAYCPGPCCCGPNANGLTAPPCYDNAWVTDGVAVPPAVIPYRSLVKIPGVQLKEADDTGGVIRQKWRKGILQIEIRFKTHEEALQWGRKWMVTKIYKRR